jgi:DNA polymerase-3 subunit epsilon
MQQINKQNQPSQEETQIQQDFTRTDFSDRSKAVDWAKKLLTDKNWIILDTETTGLGNQDEICEIAVLHPTGDVLLNERVRPTVPISPAATAIHGITDADVANSPRFDQIFIELLRAVKDSDLIIYNAYFDLRMIKQSLRALGVRLAFPTSDRRQCRIFTNGGSITCAMLWYSQWCGEWNSYYSNYKWQKLPGGDHSALGDCVATHTIIETMAQTPESHRIAAPDLEPDYDDIPF